MISNCIFYTFADRVKDWSDILFNFSLKRYNRKPDHDFFRDNAQTIKTGTTGFDSEDSEFVSIPSYEITLVKPNFNFLNGEDNYALAA